MAKTRQEIVTSNQIRHPIVLRDRIAGVIEFASDFFWGVNWDDGDNDESIRKVRVSDGGSEWSWSFATDGNWTTNSPTPRDLVLDQNGNVYVSSDNASTMYSYIVLDSDGVAVVTKDDADLGFTPFTMAVDREGNVFHVDLNETIRKTDKEGNVEWTVTHTGTNIQFPDLDYEGNIYCHDTTNDKVHKISPTGSLVWSTAAFTGESTRYPAVDATGYVIVGSSTGPVHKIDPSDGSVVWTSTPLGVDVRKIQCDKNNDIYIAYDTDKIMKLDSTGAIIFTATVSGISGFQGLAVMTNGQFAGSDRFFNSTGVVIFNANGSIASRGNPFGTSESIRQMLGAPRVGNFRDNWPD